MSANDPTYQRDYQRDLYRARKAAGLCTRCGAVEVEGATRCAPCARVIADAAAKRRERRAA